MMVLFFDYFMNIDLINFDFITMRPKTNFYNDMRELDTPILARFFEKIVDDNNKDISYSSTKLFNLFNEFLKYTNSKFDLSFIKFGIDIKKYNGIEKVKTRTNNVVNIDIKN